MEVALVMFKSDGTRRDFPVTKERVVIGRKNNCDLRIPLYSVSRQHCELRVDGDEVTLRDLGSSNGTFRNNVRVQEAALEAGDEILVGPVLFTLVIDGRPANIEPVHTVMNEEPGQGQVSSRMSASDTPQELATTDDEMPSVPEEEDHRSPTVDLDDPIAALERLAAAEQSSSGGNINNDSDELLFLPDDDDEDAQKGR